MDGEWGTYYVYGGDAQGLVIIGGDSGSPVYVRVGSQAIAIGVVSTEGQEYGLMYETLPGVERGRGLTPIRLLPALLILATLSILIGCKAATPSPSPRPTPTPDFVVQLPEGGPSTPNLLSIFDEAGVVTDARVPDEEPTDLSADISATPLAEGSVLVEWSGFACEPRPSLTVDRADERLTLFLEHGPVPDSCAAMAVPYSVLLMVDPSLDLDEIEVAESPPSITKS